MIDNVPLDDPNRNRIFVDAEDASPFARRRTEPAGKLRKIVRGMERLESVFPTAPIDEVVPFGNQVHDRTAGVPLTKRHAAIHTASALRLELVIGDGLIHFFPIEYTQLDRPPLGAFTGVLHEAFDITHLFSSYLPSPYRSRLLLLKPLPLTSHPLLGSGGFLLPLFQDTLIVHWHHLLELRQHRLPAIEDAFRVPATCVHEV